MPYLLECLHADVRPETAGGEVSDPVRVEDVIDAILDYGRACDRYAANTNGDSEDRLWREQSNAQEKAGNLLLNLINNVARMTANFVVEQERKKALKS